MVKPDESKSISDFVSLVADDRSITLSLCETWYDAGISRVQLSREQVWVLSEELHEFLVATARKVEAPA